MKKNNILLIAHNYWPENFPINKISNKILEKNFNIEVLTGKPNYPKGKIFKNYKILDFRKDNFNEIRIHRVPIFPRGNGNSFNLILNYLSFVFSGIVFGYFLLYKKKFDIVFVYAPSPILQSLIGIFFSKIFKIKLITWVQDLWPDVLYSTGHIKNKIILNIVKKIVNFIYKKNDILLVQSNEFKNIIANRVNHSNIHHLPNPGNIKYLKNNSDENSNFLDFKSKIKNSFSIVYGGNIGKVQSIETLVKASVLLEKDKSINIFIIGDGSELNSVKKLAKNLKLKNLFFLEYVNEDDLISMLRVSKLLYLSLINDDILNSTIPSKLQNYLACGKPIIGSISGEAKKIISNFTCGFTCEPENQKELANMILKIRNMPQNKLDEMGKNSLKYFLNYYHPDIINHKLTKYIDSLIIKK